MMMSIKVGASIARGNTILCTHDRRLGICSSSSLHRRQPFRCFIHTRPRPSVSISTCRQSTQKLDVAAKAADSTQSSPVSKAVVQEEGFSLAKVPPTPSLLFASIVVKLD